MDPSTISISAKIDAVMLGDEDAKGDYKMETLTLKMTSSNLNNLDAGSITKGEFTGKMNKATTGKYKGMIRFDLGSPNPEAYKDVSENAPELYALIPTNDSNTVYIQRSGSGHDVYPAITLKCDN